MLRIPLPRLAVGVGARVFSDYQRAIPGPRDGIGRAGGGVRA